MLGEFAGCVLILRGLYGMVNSKVFFEAPQLLRRLRAGSNRAPWLHNFAIFVTS